ncbi:hypothetical protein LAZ67_12001926 [Cordylochernes scorpioides]|uniref:Uncharacterized protein n=1 Tax=Cordylochernes scorpioides TaxID=51811 RepID=A0ABY6L1G0_9ARAC|nr:hypothetical protein LAZ67_12001926 [Cordylochernes scorpioides]
MEIASRYVFIYGCQFLCGEDQTTRWKTSEWQSTKEIICSCNIISHLPGPKRDGKNITTAVGDNRKFITNKIVEKMHVVYNTKQYISRIRGNFSRERDAKDTNDVKIWLLLDLMMEPDSKFPGL